MNYKFLFFVLLGIFLFAYNANASDRQFSVFFNVPTENELTDQVKSFISRELRELPDVKLVDKLVHNKKGQYFISVAAVPIKLKSPSETIGVAVSFVFKEGDWTAHNILTGSDLKSLCEKIVSIFDTMTLEPKRQK